MLTTSAAFRAWLWSKTKFSGQNADLVLTEKWHQRWYKNPVTKEESETDILLIYADKNGDRYALHIENKPAHGKWRPKQAERYRTRARDRMQVGRYVDFEIILLAPTAFIMRHPVETALFDFTISYEDVSVFVPEFAVNDPSFQA
jgi:hypothetical protein